MISTSARLGALALLSLTALTACASSASDDGGITITDPWVKAVDEGMTAAFGEITNDTDEALVLVSASTAASPMIELHETVADDAGTAMMQEKDGGFTIEPGDTLTLEPGGIHIMLMGVEDPIAAGDEVDFTLTFEDGSTVDFTATAKEFSGANEEYAGDGEMGEMGDMDHADMDHDHSDSDGDEHADHEH